LPDLSHLIARWELSRQVALHENVVGLVEAFYDGISTHFVYNYHGFAVNLALQFREAGALSAGVSSFDQDG
jgi:hypothetical protein